MKATVICAASQRAKEQIRAVTEYMALARQLKPQTAAPRHVCIHVHAEMSHAGKGSAAVS